MLSFRVSVLELADILLLVWRHTNGACLRCVLEGDISLSVSSLALSLLLSPFFYAVVMPVFVITTGLDRIELHRIHGLA